MHTYWYNLQGNNKQGCEDNVNLAGKIGCWCKLIICSQHAILLSTPLITRNSAGKQYNRCKNACDIMLLFPVVCDANVFIDELIAKPIEQHRSSDWNKRI